MSRRRFGQNERSVFGFLASAEPGGFRDFLREKSVATRELFGPIAFGITCASIWSRRF
jgi:hypothetical protein